MANAKRKARKAKRKANRQARREVRQNRKDQRRERKKLRAEMKTARVEARQQRQATRQANRQARLDNTQTELFNTASELESVSTQYATDTSGSLNTVYGTNSDYGLIDTGGQSEAGMFSNLPSWLLPVAIAGAILMLFMNPTLWKNNKKRR